MNNEFLILLAVVAVAAVGYFLFFREKPKTEPVITGRNDSLPLRLQAYERLILLANRIALPSLLQRTSYEGCTALDYQAVLARSIREEFEYNITQQVYVSVETWRAVLQLKEKNLFIINQAAAALATGATGRDLNRLLLEYLVKENLSDTHELVCQALSHEAKEMMK
jgi:hypothetical protein